MKVQELIDQLEALPPDADVVLTVWKNGYSYETNPKEDLVCLSLRLSNRDYAAICNRERNNE